MKYKFIILAIFIGSLVSAQVGGANRFNEAENTPKEEPVIAADEPDGPGDPPVDSVPIDDYLPVLMVFAVGMIGYAGYRKRKQTA